MSIGCFLAMLIVLAHFNECVSMFVDFHHKLLTEYGGCMNREQKFLNELHSPYRFIACVFTGLLLTGCATFSQDGGLGDVKSVVQKHIKQEVVWPKSADEQTTISTRVDEMLAKPISVEDAVQIALLNNKSLQSSLYDLGIAESDIVQAGRLPNPKFSMFYARNHGEYKIEQALTFNIFSLVTMPKVLEIERQHFEKTKQDVALNVLRLAYQTRVAYFNAISTHQQLDYSLQVKTSAEASAELAKRMKRAGNWNSLELAREQGFFADAVLGVLEAKNQQIRAHEALSRLLGVSVEKIKLQKRLPDLPKTTVELMKFEQGAFEQRLDLQAMRLETQNLAKRLGLTKVTRFINVFEIGPARVLEGRRGDEYKKGVDLSFELPLFDWGSAKVARAEASYMQAVNRTAQMLIDTQSEIRVAHNHYLASYEIAKQYRDEIVPLRKKVLDENQLRYNGMLVSPFELFSSARAQVDSVNTYIKKLHAFWLAEAGLQMSMIASVNLIEGNE